MTVNTRFDFIPKVNKVALPNVSSVSEQRDVVDTAMKGRIAFVESTALSNIEKPQSPEPLEKIIAGHMAGFDLSLTSEFSDIYIKA